MQSNPPAGRRPLKTRQWPIFIKLASYLAARNISPNSISVASVVFALAAGIALTGTNFVEAGWLRRLAWLLSAAMIQLRLIANLLDGMVAIEGGKKLPVGDLYNEVPDRISDPLILIGAGYAFGGQPTLGLLAAVIALFVAYIRAIGASVGVGQIFLGPFAKQQRMATMTILCVASALLPDSWQAVHVAPSIGWCSTAMLLIIVGGVITSIRRLNRIARLMRERESTSESQS